MNKLLAAVIGTSLFVSLLSASWFALHGTIHFHTDIARDFLLVEDIVVNRKMTLIGPHSGGIDGVFHGPAWLYLNVPAFILGNGNPAVVGWFWVLLMILSGEIVYFVTQKLSDNKTALMATALYGLTSAGSASNLFNPFGAVLLSPLFFYFFIRYLKKSSFVHLIISLFILGLIIQFQMAWGVPILILMMPLLLHQFIIHKKLSHVFSFGILALPLSTFILFDVRHQFIQFKSVLNYLTHSSDKTNVSILTLIGERTRGMIITILSSISGSSQLMQVLILFTILFLIYSIYTKKKKVNPSIFYLVYFYVGYWILTLFYKGTMWGYYTVPFIPLICIAIALLLKQVNKKLQIGMFVILIIPLLFINSKNIYAHNQLYFKNDSGLWKFYLTQAESVFEDVKGEFGWYVYSADQYGYSPKYAMHYVQRSSMKKGYSFEKKKVTYLIITPSTNRFTNASDWKKDKVRITRKPNKVFSFSNGSTVEKYVLTDEELKVPSASDLIMDLTFR